MKNFANGITALRIAFAAAMLLAPPFSAFFWAFYLGAGLSDLLDGIVARALGQQSDFGAKLDSAADLAFACAIAAVFMVNRSIHLWLWICVSVIAAVRLTAYGIGYGKYHTFSALHTYANKAAGGVIFLFPALYALWGMEISGIWLCVIAFVSALEELVMTLQSDELNRERKSIFLK